jgi:hypothetical protein
MDAMDRPYIKGVRIDSLQFGPNGACRFTGAVIIQLDDGEKAPHAANLTLEYTFGFRDVESIPDTIQKAKNSFFGRLGLVERQLPDLVYDNALGCLPPVQRE